MNFRIIIQWLDRHKFRLVTIYITIEIFLHFFINSVFKELALAIFTMLCELPAGLLYESMVWRMFEDSSLTLRITILAILAILTNALLVLGLISVLSKIFNLNKKHEIAE